MRPRFCVFIATSLDGFIARRDGSVDWLTADPPPEGEDFGFDEFMSDVDVIVMGRATFEQVLTFPDWPYGDRHVAVLTSRAWEVPEHLRDTVVRLAGEPLEIAERLASEGARRVYVDGGVTIQRFLAANLVDELTISRLPILLGEGRPLFGALPVERRLTHLATRAFANGLVQSRYAIERP